MPGWLSWIRPTKRAPATRGQARGLPDDVAKVIKELQIRHFDEDILRMPIKKWEEYFGAKKTKRINMAIFFRNIVWQIHEQIEAGNPPDFYHKKGFIRGMWYHIKTPLSRHKKFRKDYSGQIGRQLQLLVEKGLVSYADFNFVDQGEPYKLLGMDNPHIIVFAEKEGFWSILREIHQIYDCTVIATGGQGSFLSINYLVSRMHEAQIDLNQEFICVSITDFDPVGWNIGDEFIQKLQNSGLENFRKMDQYQGTYVNESEERRPYLWLDIIQPKNLPADEIRVAGYDFSPRVRRKKSTLAWAQATGGIDGEGGGRRGISADFFSGERMIELVGQALQPFLQIDPATAKRRGQVRRLEEALKQMLLYKVLRRDDPATGSPGAAST